MSKSLNKDIQLVGVGNAITDIIVNISEEQVVELGFRKAAMTLVELEQQQTVLAKVGGEMKLVSGGSVGNSLIAFAQLGGKAGFLGRLGDDTYGQHYRKEFDELGLKFVGELRSGENSGTCVSMVTPDSERTMVTYLGAASCFSEEDVNEELIARSEWCFIEGYLIGNPQYGHAAIDRVLELAKKHNTKIAVTFSAPFIIEVFGDQLKKVVSAASLVFANEEEGPLYTKTDSPEAALAELSKVVPHVVVTAGAEGAYIFNEGKSSHVPAFACKPIDLTGAGDMFAGAYLHEIISGSNAEEAGRIANFLANKVITQYGARLNADLKELKKSAINC